jgi:hypothetical protein
MGEYADMMLDGTCCQYCGEYIGSDAGYPQSCGCERKERGLSEITYTECGQPRPSKIRCEVCNKLVKKTGLKDHMRDKHKEQDK